MSDIRTLTRSELYQLIWSEPLTSLAPRLGVTDQGLAKRCRKHMIPTPGVGYWTQKQHGKQPPTPPLPKVSDRSLETIEFRIASGKSSAGSTDNRVGIVRRLNLKVIQSRRLPIVVGSRRAFKSSSPDNYGRLITAPGSTRPLAIKVTKESLRRAHRLYLLLDELARIADGELSIDSDGRTTLLIDQTPLYVEIAESTRRQDRPPNPKDPKYGWTREGLIREFVPTGILTISVLNPGLYRSRRAWRDTKRNPLEQQLTQIFLGLVNAARLVINWQVEIAQSQARYRIEERKRATLRHKLNSLQNLLDDFENYESAFSRLQRIKSALPKDCSEDVTDWLQWAADHLETQNPLNNLEQYIDTPIWLDSSYE